MEDRQRAGRLAGREIGRQPRALRRRRIASADLRAHRVEDDDVPGPEVVRIPRRPARPLRRVPEVAEVAGQARRLPVVVPGSRPGPAAMATPAGVVALAELLGRAVLVGVVARGEHGPRDPVEKRRGLLVAVRAALRRCRRRRPARDRRSAEAPGRRVGRAPCPPPGLWLVPAAGLALPAAEGWPTGSPRPPTLDVGPGAAAPDRRVASRPGAGAAWPRTRAPPTPSGRPRSRSARAAVALAPATGPRRIRVGLGRWGRRIGSSDMRAPA